MTIEQSNKIKNLVDVGGWDLVRKDKALWAAWLKDVEDRRNYVNTVIDR
jgi:hypothetical protein